MNTKKHMKRMGGLMAMGIGLGVGSEVLGSVGSTQGQSAVGNISKAMPIMGTMVGASMVMDAVNDINKSATIKKRRY
jgi:hypothetical protein